ncbi:MAG: hypothetical protein AAF587_30440 [Bacteroidota bacterium]
MKYLIFSLPIVSILLSFICREDSAASTQSITTFYIQQTIDGEQVAREVSVHWPDSLAPSVRYPVVIAYHGNRGENDRWVQTLAPFVREGEFIGVYPQGYENS